MKVLAYREQDAHDPFVNNTTGTSRLRGQDAHDPFVNNATGTSRLRGQDAHAPFVNNATRTSRLRGQDAHDPFVNNATGTSRLRGQDAHDPLVTFSAVLKPVFLAALCFFVCIAGQAEDWPTYQHDNHRSAVSGETLSFPLAEQWHRTSPIPPQTAWEGPAKWDAYSTQSDLKSMRNFDPAFFVTAYKDAVYFGSSVDDAAHCLDANTGEERWAYFANAPVRLPPSLSNGKAYFGSDDGFAYCVDAQTGALIWKFNASPSNRNIPSNGKIISEFPVRTGVLVDGDRAFFGASLLPWNDSLLYAINANTGGMDGDGYYVSKHNGMAMQGAMLASSEFLYVLQGRSAPIIMSRDTGKKRGVLGEEGGVIALITQDETFIAGPSSQKEDRFQESGQDGRDQLASYEGANRIVIDGGIAYLQSKIELSAFNRSQYLELQAKIFELQPQEEALKKEIDDLKKQLEENRDRELMEQMREKGKTWREMREQIGQMIADLPKSFLWRIECPHPHALIKAGQHVIAGGTNLVVAYNAETGEQAWEYPVNGMAHGLSVAHGNLYISTDRGDIYCLSAGQ